MKKNHIIAIAIVLVIQLSAIGYLMFQVNTMSNTLAEKVKIIDTLEKTTRSLSTEMKAADNKNTSKIERTNISTALCANYVVTDKIVVQYGRMSLDADEVYLDIKPQPSFAKYFEGQGKINLSDRNLKANLQEVINEFNTMYAGWQGTAPELPSFDKLTIGITANGYEVGAYSSGKIKLAGE